jgi:hypothetical protein
VFADRIVPGERTVAGWGARLETFFLFALSIPVDARASACGFGMCNAGAFHSNLCSEVNPPRQRIHLLVVYHTKVVQINLLHDAQATGHRLPVLRWLNRIGNSEYRPEENAILFNTNQPSRSNLACP